MAGFPYAINAHAIQKDNLSMSHLLKFRLEMVKPQYMARHWMRIVYVYIAFLDGFLLTPSASSWKTYVS